MSHKVKKATVFFLSGAIAVGAIPSSVSAAGPVAGIAGYTSVLLKETKTPLAGVSARFAKDFVLYGNSDWDARFHLYSKTKQEQEVKQEQELKQEQEQELKSDIQENDIPVVKSEYADIAVAQVSNYLNVRKEPSIEAEIVGKLYANGAATVKEETDEWYHVTSGNVDGYVKKEYVVVGDEELAKSVSRRVATVNTEALRVRSAASTDSNIMKLVLSGQELLVTDETIEGWIAIRDSDVSGFVSADYVTLSTEYTYAESKAEEEARLAREEAERRAREEAERRAREEAERRAREEAQRREQEARAAAQWQAQANEQKKQTSSQNRIYKAPSGTNGQSVVDYACQFVGNPYVWGGVSLTKGADCSGFVMSVYAKFGVSLPHSSYSLRSVGYAVNWSNIQPGDIVCYDGHVALYIGNNSIVHASSSKTGIIISSPANYRKVLAVRRIF